MKKIFDLRLKMATLSVVFALFAGPMVGCQKADDGLAYLTKISTVKTSWQSMSDDFDAAKGVYAKHRDFFNGEEQATIDAGLQAMDKARDALRHINEAENAGKLIATADFIGAYGEAKTGYLLVRAVLQKRADDLTEENRQLFLAFDDAAVALDDSVNKLSLNGDVRTRITQLTGLMSGIYKLVAKTGG